MTTYTLTTCFDRLTPMHQDVVELLILRGVHPDTPADEVTEMPLFIETLKEVRSRYYVWPPAPPRKQRCAFCDEPSIGRFLVGYRGYTPVRAVVCAGCKEELTP